MIVDVKNGQVCIQNDKEEKSKEKSKKPVEKVELDLTNPHQELYVKLYGQTRHYIVSDMEVEMCLDGSNLKINLREIF